jgi:DNA-binding SARP family transcriptional activator/tetratricopeptide (TPR) repeat protein
VDIRLLGPLEVSLGGTPARLDRRQERLLLALLAVHAGEVITTGRIADVLWEDEPPRTFPNAIQVHVASLRRLLCRDAFETRPEGYRLRVPPVRTDLLEFTEQERRAARALADGSVAEARQALQEALGSWRGPALQGVPGRYAESQSACLQERRLAVLERRLDLDLTLGRYSELVGELRELLTEYPLHQGLVRRLMLALHGAGRPAEALAVYRDGRRRLVDDLGVEPDGTLGETHEAILRGDRTDDLVAALLPHACAVATPPRVVPRQLPADVADFAGRTASLRELDRILALAGNGAAVPIATVTGTAGAGKTALAVHWAHRNRERFGDGDLYVDLHGYAATPTLGPADALDAFLRALDVPPARIPATEDARAALYRSLLDGRRMLVVLDNAATAEQVRPLLPAAPGCLVVVTSRSRLAGLTARHGARPVTLGALPTAEAVALLGTVLGRARVEAEPGAAAGVVESCAHLPLALRIAAERMSHAPDVPLADLAAELADQHSRLDMLATDDDTTTVRAVFSWSYGALDPEVARAFRLLGLHPGPDIGVPAAAALLGTSAPQVRRRLDCLAGVHLLERTGRDRYRLHDLLQLYAAERATDEPVGTRTGAVDRMLRWYLHTAHAADRALGPQQRHHLPLDPAHAPEPVPAFDGAAEAAAWFEAERANLCAAVRQAATESHPVAWQLPNVLWWFFYLRKHGRDWTATGLLALEAAQRLHDVDGESRTWSVLGSAYRDVHRFDDALDCYERALELRDGASSPDCRGIILHNLGITCLDVQRFDRALGYLHHALDLRRTIGDRYGEGCTLSALGDAYTGTGQLRRAADCLGLALGIFCRSGDRYGQAMTLHSLGDTYLAAGRTDQALTALRRALDLCGEIDNPDGAATVLFSLGRAQYRSGEVDEARGYLERSLALYTELGAPEAADVRTYLALARPPR